MTIFFDMDGTLADFYGVDGWLEMVRAYDPTPYAEAEVLLNMSVLARYLHKLQQAGYGIGIISCLSKRPEPTFDQVVTDVKQKWLNKHLPSVEWDKIVICSYDTPKSNFMDTENDILFDDEERQRTAWKGTAFSPDDIMRVLKELARGR